jgi:pimeloyl-ACP methyl ester carboxylesterase
MHIKVANLPDRSVRYLEAGSGRPLVLLHAFPLSADQWLPQLHRVPPGWRAVAPDLRGFRGTRSILSYIGGEPVTIDTYAADVLALMTHLEIESAVIAGVSMGGYVAFAMLRQAAPRVRGLVLANTRAAADSAESAAARDQLIVLAEREGPAAIAREMAPKLLGETSRRDQPDLEQAVRSLIESNTTEALVAALRAMKGRPDARTQLQAIGSPTLVLAGEEDAVISISEAESMRQRIPGASLVRLPRVGHLSNLEAPGAFSEALGSLLARVDVKA